MSAAQRARYRSLSQPAATQTAVAKGYGGVVSACARIAEYPRLATVVGRV